MLQYTEIQIKNGLLAILQEFSHRVLASRTISAARNNYEIITKIINILRNIPSPTSSTSTTLKTIIQSALITLFECKKYLYYHGWLTQYEFLSTMKS